MADPTDTPPPITVHTPWDLTLVVGDEVYCKELLVSTSLLTNASPPFYNMLKNPVWNP
jgi:hypothetical protein